MPQFLEDQLRQSAARKGLTGDRADRYVYGAMNNRGVMHGNQETPKGVQMETQHLEDQAKRNLAARKAVAGG